MKNNVGRDAVKLTVAKIITLGIGMAATKMLSEFRSVEEYGTFSAISTAVNLAVAFFMLGLPGSINYFLARAENKDEQKHFLSNYYSLSTLISLILGVGMFAAAPLIAQWYENDGVRTLAFVFTMLPWVNITFGGFDNVLVVKQRSTLLMIYKVLFSAALLLTIAVAQWLGLSFQFYMFLYLAVQAIFAAAIYVIVARISGGLRFSLDKTLLKKIFVFSIPLGLATVVGTLSLELGKLMIGRMMGSEALGQYTNAGKELPITFVTVSMTAVLMPQIVRRVKRNNYQDAADLWGDATVISYYVISFFVAACIVAAPQFITFLYAEKYLPGITVFRIYNLVLLLRATYCGMILNAIGKTKFIMYSSIASLALNAIFNYLCYQWLGFIGPAVATIISILVMQYMQLLATSKNIGIPLRRLMPWGKLAQITAVNAALGAAAYGVFEIFKIGTDTKGLLTAAGVGIVWFGLYTLIIYKPFRQRWSRMNNTNSGNSEEGELS